MSTVWPGENRAQAAMGEENGSNASNGSHGESQKTAVVVDGNGMESHDRKSSLEIAMWRINRNKQHKYVSISI